LIRDMCVKYCRYIIPPRSGHADETGEQYCFFCNLKYFL
jgi:hypothetical protein